MKSMTSKVLAALAAVVLFASPEARAACLFDSEFVKNGLGGRIINCPDANPISAEIYSVLITATSNASTINSSDDPLVCRFGNETLGQLPPQECIFAPGSGIAGDGIVTVLYEFGTGTHSVGCPTGTASAPASGAAPVALQVVCNDGSGVIATVGFNSADFGYMLEYATGDGGAAAPNTLTAHFNNGPAISSVVGDQVCVNVPMPVMNSDCQRVQPTSTSTATSCAARSVLDRGLLYTINAPCGSAPPLKIGRCEVAPAYIGTDGFPYFGGRESCYLDVDCPLAPDETGELLLTQTCVSTADPFDPDNPIAPRWRLLTSQPTAANAFTPCNTIAPPANVGECSYVGVTANWRNAASTIVRNSRSILGWRQVNPQGAATDKVKIDNAGFTQGKLTVAFSTSNETSIVGFNVLSGSTKLNGSLIAAKGAGSNAYTFEVGRGALRGGKSVLVEAVKSDGTVEKTAPVALK